MSNSRSIYLRASITPTAPCRRNGNKNELYVAVSRAATGTLEQCNEPQKKKLPEENPEKSKQQGTG